MANNTRNIMIGGEAGQGLVTIGTILSKVLVRSGYFIVVTQSYESRIRGGHNWFTIRVSDEEIHAPQEPVDLLVALNAETITKHQDELSDDNQILADEGFDLPDGADAIQVPFDDLAATKLNTIAVVSVLGFMLGLKKDVISDTVKQLFGSKKPELAEQNQQSIDQAWSWAEDHKDIQSKLSDVDASEKRAMMTGHEALALGAASAGLKFGAYYPMTPGTSLMLSLIKLAKYCDIKIEQAEDEISAINMAIGAAYAGAPAFVGTSGGGFALMAEGVSLAGIIETPVVVGIAQRPGPATGLPTRTEQGDLDFVLHGGHGEFVRAVYAPGSIEEFFNIGRKAMETADKFQTPVFILSDQYMSDSYRAVLPFDIESLEPTCPMVETDTDQDPYERYAITDSGISPRLVPGDTKNLVVVDSDEHTPDGHLTEDLDVRVEMADKRLRKMEGMLKEVIPPTHVGQNEPDLLLVCWGSSRGSVNQVVAELNDSNTSAAMLHFSQVWPLVPDQFLDKLEEAKRVVAVESNAFGQFARLIRRETGFHIPDMILRYDGMPITPEYIHRKLSEME